jgi:hypothetical protein
VTRYPDIMRAARDYEAFSSRYGVTITPNVNPGTPRGGFGLLRTRKETIALTAADSLRRRAALAARPDSIVT